MENVILVIHLILALCLIGVVLLQRSEGGGLGMGSGGGGGDGAMSGRAAATALGRITWILAAGFIATSITMTIIAAKNAAGSSVLDRLGTEQSEPANPVLPIAPAASDLLPPSGDATPLAPPRAAD